MTVNVKRNSEILSVTWGKVRILNSRYVYGLGTFTDIHTEKKAAAQKAEADFFELLTERTEIKEGSIWNEVEYVCLLNVYSAMSRGNAQNCRITEVAARLS